MRHFRYLILHLCLSSDPVLFSRAHKTQSLPASPAPKSPFGGQPLSVLPDLPVLPRLTSLLLSTLGCLRLSLPPHLQNCPILCMSRLSMATGGLFCHSAWVVVAPLLCPGDPVCVLPHYRASSLHCLPLGTCKSSCRAGLHPIPPLGIPAPQAASHPVGVSLTLLEQLARAVSDNPGQVASRSQPGHNGQPSSASHTLQGIRAHTLLRKLFPGTQG